MKRPTFSFRPIAFALAAASVVFVTVTAAHRYQIHDGPPIVAYGFPVPWHAANGAVSMARDVDLRAMLFDFVLYALPMLLVVGRWRFLERWPRATLGVTLAMSLIGAMGLLVASGGDPFWTRAAPEAGWVIRRETRLHVGWDFPSR